MPPPEPVHDHSKLSDAARVVVMGVSGCGTTTFIYSGICIFLPFGLVKLKKSF